MLKNTRPDRLAVLGVVFTLAAHAAVIAQVVAR